MMKREQTERLLDRYLDGDTTDAEEQQLRDFFSTTEAVPAEWKAYGALFRWEATQQKAVQGSIVELSSVNRRRRVRMAVAAGIAALIMMGAGLAAMLQHTPAAEGQTDYAVIDGQYTTDAAVIATEAEEALLMVSVTDELN